MSVTIAYIGLGSNLNDPQQQILTAFDALDSIDGCQLTARSSLYGNPPMGPQDQPDYVNAVAELETSLSAQQLLTAMLETELAFGRDRNAAVHWGPRILDLDLLVFGAEVIDEPALKVPHTGICDRNFVLLPLMEIAPALEVPGLGKLRDLAQRFAVDELRKLN